MEFLSQPWFLGMLLLAVGTLAALGFLGTRRRGSRPKNADSIEPANSTIDLERLTLEPLRPGAPLIDLYGTRTRLVVLVLAPAGRGTDFPDRSQWHELVDCIVPGLTTVLDHHRPTFRLWPEQVSQHGFVQAFFNSMRAGDSQPKTHVAPKRHPRGTRYYRLAGRVDWQGVPVLVGLVLTGDGPALSPIEIEHPGKWLDLLKVRT